MTHTKTVGDISEAFVAAHLLEKGYAVLKPLGDNLRYDLVVDRGNGFERLQVKTGRRRGGVIIFNSCSSLMHHGGDRKDYIGEIDYFAVWDRDGRKVYLVPVAVAGTRETCLRLEPARNGQLLGIRHAVDFEL